MERIVEVDAIRGIAIVAMVVYHLIFDLDYFGIITIKLYDLPLLLFQRLIGVLFMLLVGVSITLSESHNREGYARHAKRALKLSIVALLITIATWIYPHEGFITFGIIHSIALATFLAPFFFRFRQINVLIGLAIISAGLYVNTIQTDSHYFFWLGLTYPGYAALDYYPIMPWFGVVLIGLYAGQIFFPNGRSAIRIAASPLLLNTFAALGRNSLAIYLVHQPVLVGIILTYKMLF